MSVLEWLEWVALGVAVLAGGSVVYYTLRTGISPMPSSDGQRRAVLKAIGSVQGPIYELGAGWGTLAFALADAFPQAQVVAVEVSPVPVGVMRLRQALRPRKNLAIRRADYLREPLADAEVLVTYLFVEGMERLKKKVEAEGRPGGRWVTHTFAVHGWKPESEQRLDDADQTSVLVYRLR